MIDQDLLAHLVALGTAAGARVHLGNAQQDTPFPFIVIRRTGGTTPRTLGGVSLFVRTNFSLNVIAKEYADAYPIALAIKASLHGYRGTMGTTDVQGSRCTNEATDVSEIDGDKVFRWLQQDYLITYR